WRLVFLTFFGEPRWAGAEHEAHGPAHGETSHDHARQEDHTHQDGATSHDHAHALDPHEAPLSMLVPLGVLAIGALLAGFIFAPYFIGEATSEFWKSALYLGPENHILEAREEVPELANLLPTILMGAGFLIAVWFYVLAPAIPDWLAAHAKSLYEFLLNKWYFDELYDAIFVRPAFALGRLFWKGGDGAIIDRLGPDGIAARVVDVTGRVVKLQSGYIYHYAFAMLVGLAAVTTWYMVLGIR
ncbi:MAG: NADH-quinone oxidoreductase subunit L, partial [Alphaproteobacteria bacterium]|nr:NADH-quinone oxidoreductase subunit L [Alphaproteobacteria bacterium]